MVAISRFELRIVEVAFIDIAVQVSLNLTNAGGVIVIILIILSFNSVTFA